MVYGFTCGTFDLIHPGHIRMFKECKTVCDFLIVGVQTDPTINRPEKNKPIQTWEERAEMVDAIKEVDRIVKYTDEASLIRLLTLLRRHQLIDIRIIGEDHRATNFTGWELGIPIYFNSRNHTLSTSELRRRVCQGS